MKLDQDLQESSISTDLPILFRTLTGDHIPAKLQRIFFGPIGNKAHCRIAFAIEREAASRIWDTESFHVLRGLHQEKQLPAFEAQSLIFATAELRPSLAHLAAQRGWDAEDMLVAFMPNAATEHRETVFLQQTECWLLTEMIQEVSLPQQFESSDSLKTGMRTYWHRSSTSY